MNKKVSIIIPAWFEKNQNGKYGLNETYVIASQCLKRLIDVTPRELYELIIVDNGSTLTTKDIQADIPSLEWYWEQADVLIKNKENKGFASAINQGMAKTNCKYIMQMNNDLLIWGGFLEQMLKDFEEAKNFNPPVGLLMPAIVKEKINFWDAIKLKKEEIDMKTNAGNFGIKAEFGSCYLGEKEVFMKIAKNRDGYQVLDENFKIGFGEDRWLYREIRMLGLETWRTHNLRVMHVGGVSMSKAKRKIGTRELIDKNREYLAGLKKKYNIE